MVTLAITPALATARGDAVAGREKADTERCLECHGANGPGQGNSQGSDGKFARLGGQHADYIVKQIGDFRSGRRKHEFMQMMANSISDDDLYDIAAYFAAEPKMAVAKGDSSQTKAQAEAQIAARSVVAQRLYELGDPGRQVAPCASCHGAKAEGVAGVGPALGGQGLRYLIQQLGDWRNGSRANSAGSVMNQFAKPLSDDEITSLAHYLSGM
jgi:cytochrome c553